MVTVSTSRNHHSLVLIFSLCDSNNSSSSTTNLASRFSDPSTSTVTWQVDREEEGLRLPVIAGSWQPTSDHLLPNSSSSFSSCCSPSSSSSGSSSSRSTSSSFCPSSSSSSSSKRHHLKILPIASVPEVRFRPVTVKGKEVDVELNEDSEEEGKGKRGGVKGGGSNIFATLRCKRHRKKKENRNGWKLGFLRALKLRNASLVTLLSGAVGGAVSRTAVAPLETIRTHLMVGSAGSTAGEVFRHIMHTEGWKGLFRGNGINVIRIAPSKAIEMFIYDAIKNILDKRSLVPSCVPLPTSSIAGGIAGACSTFCTYPLELLKTRLTVQHDVYNGILDGFVKIYRQGGTKELYRGLTPTIIGVVPYTAANYFVYDLLRRLYKRVSKNDNIGNLQTLLIASVSAALASASTFPLEVGRKQMQVGPTAGHPMYDNMVHAIMSVVKQQGVGGLYRGIGPSCMKLIPAAGISFMFYEASKNVFMEEEETD